MQPTNWGKELGVINLELIQKNGKWSVQDDKSSVERRSVDGKIYGEGKNPIRTESPAVNNPIISENKLLKAAHEKTVQYVNSGVGKSTKDLNSFLSLVADDSSVELVANAQKWYVEKIIKKGEPDLAADKNLQILSAAVPFKAGGRDFKDATSFVDIKA